MVGALVDGAVRDTSDLQEMGFPVFCRRIGPGYIVGKSYVAAVGEPVRIGGRTVAPGDVIVADNDGVIVIPPDEVEAVVTRALAINAWEKPRHANIADGMDYKEVERLSGPLP
jgi:regulator of RNase E activity RraA